MYFDILLQGIKVYVCVYILLYYIYGVIYTLAFIWYSVIPYQILNSKSNNRHSLCHHYKTCYMQVK